VKPDRRVQGDFPGLCEADDKGHPIIRRLSALVLAFALATSQALGQDAAYVQHVTAG
jgi:hypothetical protein